MAKVIDDDGGWDSNIMRGIEWLIEQKVDIISCSLGATYIPPNGADPSALAFQAAIDHGITVVNSEGNEGPGQGTVGSAPDLKNVLAVGATTGYRLFSQIGYLADGNAYKGDQVITWSSRGPNSLGDFRPDIMGFGAWGWALAPTVPATPTADVDIQDFGGTSMAAPVVAGDLALAESAWKMTHPGRRLPAPSYWKNLLASTATDLGYPALDQSSGLVNAAAAVREVLGQGKSFLASVAADPKNPSSWSARVAGGARAATTIAVRNTGAKAERVTLKPTTFATFKTITHAPITLTGPDYTRRGELHRAGRHRLRAGPGHVAVRARRLAAERQVYDSHGNFVSYGETDGGYGHLSFDQVSLRGPAGQRPVVAKGEPWKIDIDPPSGMAPSAPQIVHLSDQLHAPGARHVDRPVAQERHDQAGSARLGSGPPSPPRRRRAPRFSGIVVSNGASTTTIPVAVRVPVKLTNGTAASAARSRARPSSTRAASSTSTTSRVPAGTRSITASLHWPDTGNLVNLYLIDPNGDLRDAKGGDLVWYPDYSSFTVPDAAFTHTAEQVIWDYAQGRHVAGDGVGGRLQRQLVRRALQRLGHPQHAGRRAGELDGHGPGRRHRRPPTSR